MPDLDHCQPICIPAQPTADQDASHPPVNMRPLRNGVIVRLTQDRLIVGDLWECPDCGARIIDRKGQGKMVERWQGEIFDHLERRLNAMGSNVQVGYPERNEVYGYAE